MHSVNLGGGGLCCRMTWKSGSVRELKLVNQGKTHNKKGLSFDPTAPFKMYYSSFVRSSHLPSNMH